MRDRFVGQLETEAAAWVVEGLVTEDQALRIVARYEDRDVLERPSSVLDGLYALAGVMVGASSLVFLLVGFHTGTPWALTAVGLAFGGTGVYLHRRTTRDRLGDAFLVAALVPLSLSAFFDDLTWTIALAIPAALVVLRRDTLWVAALATVALSVSLFAALVDERGEWPAALWLALQLGVVAGLVAMHRATQARSQLPVALATTTAIIAVIATMDEHLDVGLAAGFALFGLVMAAFGAAGSALRQKGVILASGLAFGIDTIAFAFTVGGALTGTLTLVAGAALVVWQAEAVRRYLGDAVTTLA